MVTIDVLLGVYLILAFAAFDKPDNGNKRCQRVSINIADESTNGFLSARDIKERLQKSKLYPYGQELAYINTRQIEEQLKSSAFVKTAQCYTNNEGDVIITLTQRLPILRIMSGSDDYYIDDNNNIMRPSSNYTSDLIIATGYISKWYARNYLSHLAAAIMDNELWRSQIVQINILPDRGVELVPRVGDHIIYIGKLPETKYIADRKALVEDFIARKMNRLEKFYKYGLSQAGWNKYSYINLEFDNQIICKKRTLN